MTLAFLSCSSEVTIEEVAVEEEIAEDLFVKLKKDYSSFVQAIIGDDSIGFRSVLPSMSMSEIRGVESATHEETDSLIVRFIIEEGIEQNAELEYFFNEDSIFNHLEMTIYNSTIEQRDSLYNDLNMYLNTNFTIHENEGGFNYSVDSMLVNVKKDGTEDFPNVFIHVKQQTPLL